MVPSSPPSRCCRRRRPACHLASADSAAACALALLPCQPAGAPLPLPIQRVSEAAWNDEAHVAESLALYQTKFRMADEVFAGRHNRVAPEGGFFLWLPVPDGDGEAAALKLWRETGVRVLPGAYLSRDAGGDNPGKGYIRVALVAPKEETLGPGSKQLRQLILAAHQKS